MVERDSSWGGRESRGAAWLMLARIATGGLDFVSRVVFGRLLLPAEMAVFVSLAEGQRTIALLAVGVGVSIAQRVAPLAAAGKPEQVAAILLGMLKWWLSLAAVVMGIAFVLSPWLADGLQLDGVTPVILALLIVPCSLAFAILNGGLHGREAYGRYALTAIVHSSTRFGLGVLLILAGMGANGAVAAYTLGFAGAALAAAGLQQALLRRGTAPMDIPVRDIAVQAIPAAVGVLGAALLMGADVIVTKTMFSAELAGIYSAVATLGKIPIDLAGPLIVIVLPKSARVCERKAAKSALTAIGISMATSSVIVVGFFVAPTLAINYSFGPLYTGLGSLLGNYALVAMGIAVVQIMLCHMLARRDRVFPFIVLLVATVQVCIYANVANDPTDIVRVMGLSAAFLIVVGSLIMGIRVRQSKTKCDGT